MPYNYLPAAFMKPSGFGRAILGAGFVNGGGTTNAIDYFHVMTTSNSTDFGDTAASSWGDGGTGNQITANMSNGGWSAQNTFVLFCTLGNSAAFGTITGPRTTNGGLGNQVRCMFYGGENNGGSKSNVIDYWNPQIKGNAVDFGDMVSARVYLRGRMGNQVRGVIAGGND